MAESSGSVRNRTGALFGDLWHRYDDALFRESVELFRMRCDANGFDRRWLAGKTCLDAGCGGGRNSIAMALEGAGRVIGCDISEAGLRDAASRARDITTIRFVAGSVLDLPFADGSFDFIWCAGVLHHTEDPDRGLSELVRILRDGGKLFLLLYGAGGLRWPTIMAVRPDAQALGYAHMDKAIRAIGLPANRQRTFLDDLFVPLIDFYDDDRVRSMLARHGLVQFTRWNHGKLDHEESVDSQRQELVMFRAVFQTAEAQSAVRKIEDAIRRLDDAAARFASREISARELSAEVFGCGHHRIMAEKGGLLRA